MDEEWRDIEGYEGLYQVSNLGRVKSFNYRGHKGCIEILTPRLDGKGYEMVALYKEGKVRNTKVHRLVAQAFIPNPNNYPQVNHKDENKTNNDVKNLEWCTNKYNHNYGTRNERVGKSLSKKVICITTGEIFNSMREACRKYNIHTGSMTECCRGKQKTAGGYKWEYFKEEI
mgnify:FL=1